MKRLPKAVIYTKRLSSNALIIAAQSLHNGLVAQAVTYPAPPIVVTDFQTTIDAYQAASVAAVKGTKDQTAAKHEAKQNMINAMRAEITYINQVVQDTYEANPSMNYDTLRNMILSAGVKNLKNITRPNTLGNVKTPITISAIAKDKSTKYGTNVNGVLKIRVQIPVKYKTQAIKTWWLQYRLKATPANPWSDFHSTTTRIQVTGLDAGTYEYMVAGVPGIFMGKDQLNWSTIQETVVT